MSGCRQDDFLTVVVLMLSSTNFWMCFGLIYLVTGVFILRKEISAARGWDKLITLGR
jgi:hypothetical protein